MGLRKHIPCRDIQVTSGMLFSAGILITFQLHKHEGA